MPVDEEVVRTAWNDVGRARQVQDKITVFLLVDPIILQGWLLEMKAKRQAVLATVVDESVNP